MIVFRFRISSYYGVDLVTGETKGSWLMSVYEILMCCTKNNGENGKKKQKTNM